jgi:hypothetical protein
VREFIILSKRIIIVRKSPLLSKERVRVRDIFYHMYPSNQSNNCLSSSNISF